MEIVGCDGWMNKAASGQREIKLNGLKGTGSWKNLLNICDSETESEMKSKKIMQLFLVSRAVFANFESFDSVMQKARFW